MITRAVRFSFALPLFLTLVAIPARSEERTASTDVQHLELGDRYAVVIRRDKVEQSYFGQLVQKTDDWIVIRTVSEGRSEHGVPVLSSVPYANRMFVNVGIGRITDDYWIPRRAATVTGRVMVTDKSEFKPLDSDHPDWKKVKRIELAKDGELSEHSGKASMEGEELRFLTLTVRDIKAPWPLLGQLPLVGYTFSSRELELVEEELTVSMESLISVQVPMESKWERQEDVELSSAW